MLRLFVWMLFLIFHSSNCLLYRVVVGPGNSTTVDGGSWLDFKVVLYLSSSPLFIFDKAVLSSPTTVLFDVAATVIIVDKAGVISVVKLKSCIKLDVLFVLLYPYKLNVVGLLDLSPDEFLSMILTICSVSSIQTSSSFIPPKDSLIPASIPFRKSIRGNSPVSLFILSSTTSKTNSTFTNMFIIWP